MDTERALTLLAARDLLVGIAPFVIGLFVVLVLILAVAYGMRLLRRGDMSQSEPSAPRPPDSPKGYGRDHTEPDEMPHDGRRRFPYEVRDTGVHGTDSDPDEKPARWHDGGSSFGSGGPGHTG